MSCRLRSNRCRAAERVCEALREGSGIIAELATRLVRRHPVRDGPGVDDLAQVPGKAEAPDEGMWQRGADPQGPCRDAGRRRPMPSRASGDHDRVAQPHVLPAERSRSPRSGPGRGPRRSRPRRRRRTRSRSRPRRARCTEALRGTPAPAAPPASCGPPDRTRCPARDHDRGAGVDPRSRCRSAQDFRLVVEAQIARLVTALTPFHRGRVRRYLHTY